MKTYIFRVVIEEDQRPFGVKNNNDIILYA